MKKTVAVVLCMLFLTMVLSACAGRRYPAANPISDFEYEINDRGGITITKYIGESEQVVIPQQIEDKDVLMIGKSAFSETAITSLIMPDTVIYILPWAFVNCNKLETVEISTSLQVIGLNAFQNCMALETIDLSMATSMESIEDEAFRGCLGLREITFSDSIVRIGKNAFFQCESLEQIILPKNLQEIGESAFCACTGAKKIWIPKTIENWGYLPFAGVTSLEEIVFEDGIKKIGAEALLSAGALRTVTIPASVEVLSSGAFMECRNLKEVYFEGAAPLIGTGKFNEFVSPVQDVKIYYDPSMPGWDGTPLRDIYTLIPISDYVVYYSEIPLYVVANACAGVTPESHQNALSAMKMCQVEIV